MTSRNPYHVQGDPVPRLRQSALAYCDILGYSQMVETSYATGTGPEMLAKLYEALSSGRTWLEGKLQEGDLVGEAFKHLPERFALKAFTDNIVMGWPIRDDAESELFDALDRLSDFQLQMATAGFFVRGGIALGDAYVDDIAVFGHALLDAHAAEATLARDPRIVLSQTAIEAIKLHLTYYPNKESSPQARMILRDTDGQWFLNYLNAVMWLEDDCGPAFESLVKHKVAVEQRLIKYQALPTIWSKYAWVAGYHNYFCDANDRWFGQEHKIDLDLYRARPRLIID
jgi:hypothetical protein